MRINPILIATVLFAVCCNPSENKSEGTEPATTEQREITVMSFNVLVTHDDDEGEELWSVRGPACADMILEEAPDIIGIQECRQAQFESLFAALSEEYSGINIPESKKNFGTCLFWRKEVFDCYGSGYLWFSNIPTVPSPAFTDICDDPTYRTYIWADLRLRGTEKGVRLYSTHFPRKYTLDNSEARHKCAQTMVDHAKKACGEDATVFVTGDMNCSLANESGRYCLLPFTSWMKSSRASLPDSKRDNWYSMNSFSNDAPIAGGEKSIDHIFFREAEVLSYRTVTESFSGVRFLSDHYPVIAEFKISY